jgi:hypothetical protein
MSNGILLHAKIGMGDRLDSPVLLVPLPLKGEGLRERVPCEVAMLLQNLYKIEFNVKSF